MLSLLKLVKSGVGRDVVHKKAQFCAHIEDCNARSKEKIAVCEAGSRAVSVWGDKQALSQEPVERVDVWLSKIANTFEPAPNPTFWAERPLVWKEVDPSSIADAAAPWEGPSVSTTEPVN